MGLPARYIREIEFPFGGSVGGGNLSISPTALTIFVGPNNSGKSLVLRELAQKMGAQIGAGNLIGPNIKLRPLDEGEVRYLISNYFRPVRDQHLQYMKLKDNSISVSSVEQHLKNPNMNGSLSVLGRHWLKGDLLFVDGRTRMSLINSQPRGNLTANPENSFQRLYRDNDTRGKLSKIFYKSFGKYFILDATNGDQLQIRMSSVAPPVGVERSLEENAINFMRQSPPIEAESDGVKAYIGILLALYAEDPSLIFIDEPEAFLHPSLAMALGREIGKSLSAEGRYGFISTHSSSFLMGCILSGAEINVVRLTYKGGVPTARILPSDQLRHLMRNPLLRSSNVLSAIFFDSAVVCEADSDRAFYEEINERLLRSNDQRALSHALFLNAQGKDTISEIVEPLRRLGIPAVSLFDIDVIRNANGEFKKALNSAGISEDIKASLSVLRDRVGKNISDYNEFKSKGLGYFQEKSSVEASSLLISQINEYGVFAVPVGQLESWLRYLDVTGQKQGWLVRMFKRLGEDPASSDYVVPQEGDVWDFIGQISKWVDNPNRKGIPA